MRGVFGKRPGDVALKSDPAGEKYTTGRAGNDGRCSGGGELRHWELRPSSVPDQVPSTEHSRFRSRAARREQSKIKYPARSVATERTQAGARCSLRPSSLSLSPLASLTCVKQYKVPMLLSVHDADRGNG